MKKMMMMFLILCQFLSIFSEKVTFDKLLEDLKKDKKMKKMAIAGADNEETLKTSRLAKDMGLGDSILIGDEIKIKSIAKENEIDISDFKLVNIEDPIEITRYAIKLVHDNQADMFVKGSIETKNCLIAAFDREIGLRTDRIISLVTIFELEGKIVLLTDPSVIPYPTLQNKVEMINNAVKFARLAGIEVPKVAVVTAIDIVNPRMRETMEAEDLKIMNEKGQIENCIVDGPLSLDLAISPESAMIKKSDRKINGDADIILFPDVHSANIAYKILAHLGDCKSGNILLGTSKPVILTSRSDNVQVKMDSIILGLTYDKITE